MKSICIKSNNNNILSYLSSKFVNANLENIYISLNSFKIYNNIIIHSKNNSQNIFLEISASFITDVIIEFYEENYLIKKLNRNFFYFSSYDKKRILELYRAEISSNIEQQNQKYLSIYSSVYDYLKENHSLVLNGFFNFRLSKYLSILNDFLDNCINLFLIEREYYEFIDLLKIYINNSPSKVKILHLVFSTNKIILLDENYIKIDFSNSELSEAKFLSDITFSENDYVLNYILNVIPTKLIVHISNSNSDYADFLNTLKLIFEKKLVILQG